jgi:hypothetical protein
MSNKKFREPSDAIAVITRNGGNVTGNQIRVVSPGLKMMSAIDFLVNYCHYQVFYSL